MSRAFQLLSTSLLTALASLSVHADEVLVPNEVVLTQNHTASENEEAISLPSDTQATVQKPRVIASPKKESFHPFTGRVKAKKVRMRINPDIESHIVRELSKGELISVVDDKGEFWAIDPPSDCKAYVFRSFVLDNVVEGSRVNVRLEPNLEAPVITHLNAGEKIHGSISHNNNKWLEITPPKTTHFYVAKDYIEYAGAPDLKASQEKRKNNVTQMMEAAQLLSKTEMKRPFDQIEIEKLTRNFKTIAEEYSDFPEIAEKAQTSLSALQEEYLQKRLAHLEERAAQAPQDSQEEMVTISPSEMTDRMKMWEHVEEALYLSWANVNEDKSMDQYYQEQRFTAVPLTGTVEVYQTAAKSKPGDFVLRDQSVPKACLYSTKVDLQKLVGKKVTLLAVERPNNNFAFPAYYVVAAE